MKDEAPRIAPDENRRQEFQPRTARAARQLAAVCIGLLWLAGCQQKMAVQPSYRPLHPCEFFDDGRSARPLAAGTVARGHLRIDYALYQGTHSSAKAEALREAEADQKVAGSSTDTPITPASPQREDRDDYIDTFPFPISLDILEHGRNRYMIYCVVCHDALGSGTGKIVQRGYSRPPSYHIARLREAPVGYLFAVISRGYGSMPSYAAQIPPRDRWAIVAYVRALQASQHFALDDLTTDMRAEVNQQQVAATAQELP